MVVPKLDRLARSVPDAHQIGGSLAVRGALFSLGGTVFDPSDLMGKCFFNVLATFAEFEVDLLRMRTQEGWRSPGPTASSNGKPPKLSARQHAQLLKLNQPESTRSPRSPSCSQSAAAPSTVRSNEHAPPAHDLLGMA